ncbi:hypothetical protein Taro_044806 [Colocasia esculenta]|uniref:Uncharacterized protein n=1 Tax=Colocasia esculenta TaxID=4460 RepID=A0A843WZ02_COLES|nr:hypothetical protein [Colocasia esculenta]
MERGRHRAIAGLRVLREVPHFRELGPEFLKVPGMGLQGNEFGKKVSPAIGRLDIGEGWECATPGSIPGWRWDYPVDPPLGYNGKKKKEFGKKALDNLSP